MWLINRLQYIKQLVIELESLVEANGVAIKKPLSHIAFLIEQLQPFQTNKEVWFTSINQEELKTVQQHLININLAIINALHDLSQIDVK